jgi:hypothetical protein
MPMREKLIPPLADIDQALLITQRVWVSNTVPQIVVKPGNQDQCQNWVKNQRVLLTAPKRETWSIKLIFRSSF